MKALAWLAYAAWAVVTWRVYSASHGAGITLGVATIIALTAEGRAHFARVRRGSSQRTTRPSDQPQSRTKGENKS